MGTLNLAAPLVLLIIIIIIINNNNNNKFKIYLWRRASYEPVPVSPSPFLSSSSHTTQLHNTNSYTYSHLNLNFLQHCTDTLQTRNVVCPSGAWFENRPHSTPSIRLVRNPKRVIVQWVGIRTQTHVIFKLHSFLVRHLPHVFLLCSILLFQSELWWMSCKFCFNFEIWIYFILVQFLFCSYLYIYI